ncbi:MAG: hypothetical protein ACTS3F_08785 [Phycisphaerales bacterium]
MPPRPIDHAPANPTRPSLWRWTALVAILLAIPAVGFYWIVTTTAPPTLSQPNNDPAPDPTPASANESPGTTPGLVE